MNVLAGARFSDITAARECRRLATPLSPRRARRVAASASLPISVGVRFGALARLLLVSLPLGRFDLVAELLHHGHAHALAFGLLERRLAGAFDAHLLLGEGNFGLVD